jgi:hypothetical protein
MQLITSATMAAQLLLWRARQSGCYGLDGLWRQLLSLISPPRLSMFAERGGMDSIVVHTLANCSYG